MILDNAINTSVENRTAPASNTIGAVWRDILRNPAQLVRRWNYKSAIFSSIMRSSIFLFTYLQLADKENNGRNQVLLAFGAAGAQFAYRFLSAGIIGSLIQSFRRVEPAWAAMAMIMLLIPAVSHLFEFLVQLVYGTLTHTTGRTDEAILRSICVSVVSTLFNLFAMRRGILLVGAEDDRKSLWEDIKAIPRIVFDFIVFIPLEIATMLRRGNYIAALAGLIGFGLFAEILCWAMFGKPYWTFSKGKWEWWTFWGIDAVLLMLFAAAAAYLFLQRKSKPNQL